MNFLLSQAFLTWQTSERRNISGTQRVKWLVNFCLQTIASQQSDPSPSAIQAPYYYHSQSGEKDEWGAPCNPASLGFVFISPLRFSTTCLYSKGAAASDRETDRKDLLRTC
jgi:hypothetical protein